VASRDAGFDGAEVDGAEFDGADFDGADFEDAGYEGDGDGGDGGPAAPVPVLAVVGRPNVGKSTMVNRILGSRQAVVEDVPGVTRDRVNYDATWRGRAFTMVDTGGWDPEVEGRPVLAARVAAQARVAVDAADAVLFVVDAVVGITDADAAVAAVLRRSRKPVVVAANKVDDAPGESNVGSLWALGLGEPQSVSALHGRGSGDLLDAILDALPPAPGERFDAPAGPRRVALIGRPNVGKSSLLNRLAGQDRVLVDAVAGTTRDPVDELIDLGGKTWRFVDTAGIRRRMRETQGADYFAALRTERALERAEVAVVLVDASEPLAEQDLRIISMVIDAGRALVIAYNKWDLVDADRRESLDREIDRQLYTARWAPRVNLSAATGWHVERLVPALQTALASWETRVQTGRRNAWLTALIAATPPPVRGGKQPKVMFATQAGIRPPHFVLFTTGFLQAGYRRFIERRLREEFGFEGSPVHVTMRLREKRQRAGGRPAGGARRG
jgi:GTPase